VWDVLDDITACRVALRSDTAAAGARRVRDSAILHKSTDNVSVAVVRLDRAPASYHTDTACPASPVAMPRADPPVLRLPSPQSLDAAAAASDADTGAVPGTGAAAAAADADCTAPSQVRPQLELAEAPGRPPTPQPADSALDTDGSVGSGTMADESALAEEPTRRSRSVTHRGAAPAFVLQMKSQDAAAAAAAAAATAEAAPVEAGAQ
jgi:hypothetical protein